MVRFCEAIISGEIAISDEEPWPRLPAPPASGSARRACRSALTARSRSSVTRRSAALSAATTAAFSSPRERISSSLRCSVPLSRPFSKTSAPICRLSTSSPARRSSSSARWAASSSDPMGGGGGSRRNCSHSCEAARADASSAAVHSCSCCR
eukprot:scaffold97178_cov63-Phaeocystis_antarctica.AAC.1